MEDGKGRKCHFHIVAGLKSERRTATKEVVSSGARRNENTAWGKWQWPLTSIFFVATSTTSSPCFCDYLTPLWQDASILSQETMHNTHFFHKHIPHEQHSCGYEQGQPSALGPGYGQLSWNISHQIQRHKPVIGFAEFLLGEVCFLQGYDSEIHRRRPQSTASNENYCYFCFLQ